MIGKMSYGVIIAAFYASGVMCAYTETRREKFILRRFCCFGLYLAASIAGIRVSLESIIDLRMLLHILAFGFLVISLYGCWKMSWSLAFYRAIWAFMVWQLLYELWWESQSVWGVRHFGFFSTDWLSAIGIYLLGYLLAAFSIAKWLQEESTGKIGPRQLISALLIFTIFMMTGVSLGNPAGRPENWQALYPSQLLLVVVLYLQNELFHKSVMRHELEVMNLIWKKEQEQYQLSKENIALINQKSHDLKHQLRAIRNCSAEDREKYLKEMEESVQIYEAIVKTGNEVLDTILTEKSLYCKERGITVSCVADGSQMDFINMVDLYAILGNALDNAIEAVEKFKHEEKRQIDVLIYRQKGFLVMNIINPMKETLVYEEELPVSTKGDRRYHGFGLRSIRHLVEKYGGFVNISEEDGCFSLKILIPTPLSQAT